MLVAGIDVGSTETKICVIKNGEWYHAAAPTGWKPRESGEKIYRELISRIDSAERADFVVATGYGRIALPFADRLVTEITCHARGGVVLVPKARMIIDIGGQDTKVIQVGPEGQVLDFLMNDRCAAGTGRFLQVIATSIGLDVEELDEIAAEKEPIALNSMCTVFAETEVIGLLASGADRGELVAGLQQAIAQRIGGMAKRLGISGTIAFTGGVAHSRGVQRRLQDLLNTDVVVSKDCQLAGAIGAALIAQDAIES